MSLGLGRLGHLASSPSPRLQGLIPDPPRMTDRYSHLPCSLQLS